MGKREPEVRHGDGGGKEMAKKSAHLSSGASVIFGYQSRGVQQAEGERIG